MEWTVIAMRRASLVGLLALTVASGCDGQDPDRLNRVGKKLVSRGRRVADDANLPKVTVTMPPPEKAADNDQTKPNKVSIPEQND